MPMYSNLSIRKHRPFILTLLNFPSPFRSETIRTSFRPEVEVVKEKSLGPRFYPPHHGITEHVLARGGLKILGSYSPPLFHPHLRFLLTTDFTQISYVVASLLRVSLSEGSRVREMRPPVLRADAAHLVRISPGVRSGISVIADDHMYTKNTSYASEALTAVPRWPDPLRCFTFS